MAYVFELIFDPVTESAIRSIWRRISDTGLPSSQDAMGYTPHISLVVCDDCQFDETECYQKTMAYAQGIAPFPIHVTYLGVFAAAENVIFLGVAPSAMLLARHQEVLDLCRQHQATYRDYYSPGKWTPHITLAFNLTQAQVEQCLPLGWDVTWPLVGMAHGLRLVEVRDECARDVFTCEFSALNR